MNTFFILLVIGLFALGRNQRLGILSALTNAGTAAPTPGEVVYGGGADAIPNSNGYVQTTDTTILETGSPATVFQGTLVGPPGTVGQIASRSLGGRITTGFGGRRPRPGG